MIINYVSKYQLPPVIDASHTTPITHVNRNPMLLKLIGKDIVYTLGGFRTYLKSRPQTPSAEPGCTVRYHGNNITLNSRDVSHPREPYSGTLSRLRNLYPRST